MSKAYEDQRNAPIRRYLLRALARAGLSATEHDILLIIFDETYGWMRPGQKNWSIRKDRAPLDYNYLAREISTDENPTSYSTVSKCMGRLMKRNIVIQYESPTKTSSGVYGINSEPETWLSKQNIPSKKRQGINGDIPGKKRQGIRSKTARNNRANPHEQRPGGALNTVYNTDPPIVPHGDRPTVLQKTDVRPVIKEPKDAAAIDDLDFEAAMSSAERAYIKEYARPLIPDERIELNVFLSTVQHTGSMLAIWLAAIPEAEADRQKRKADPEQRRYVKKRPFEDILETASAIYRRKKAKSQDRPGRRETANQQTA